MRALVARDVQRPRLALPGLAVALGRLDRIAFGLANVVLQPAETRPFEALDEGAHAKQSLPIFTDRIPAERRCPATE
ncbi:hypothetical protein D3C85_1333150 [compost metagenome]